MTPIKSSRSAGSTNGKLRLPLRKSIASIVTATILGAASIASPKVDFPQYRPPIQALLEREVSQDPTNATRVPLSSLERTNAPAYLAEELFGAEVTADTAVADFEKTLAKQWERKRKIIAKTDIDYTTKEREISRAAQNTVRSLGKIAGELYRANPRRTTLQQRITGLNTLTSTLAINTNFNALQDQYRLSPQARAAIETYAHSLGGKELVSIQLSEIIPSSKADASVAAYDLLLRHGGVQLIRARPSEQDKLISHTEYQLTQNAIDAARRCDKALPEALRTNITSISDPRLLSGNLADQVAWQYHICMAAGFAGKGVLPPVGETDMRYASAMHLRPRTLLDERKGLGSSAKPSVAAHVDAYRAKTVRNFDALRAYE